MRVKLFTHNDLDGVGCAIIAKRVFGIDSVDVEYCDYKEVDNKVRNFFSGGEHAKYNRVFITDISVNKETAEFINNKISVDKLKLIDHHATALWLNDKFSWSRVKPLDYMRNMKTSGTSLLLNFLIMNDYYSFDSKENVENIDLFSETVRRWDTWDWHNIYKDEVPKRLNNLLYLLGRERFVNRFSQDLSLQFNEGEQLLLSIEEEKIENYISKVCRNIYRINMQGYKAGLVFAEQYISELGNTIASSNPDLDFAVIVNPGGKSMSFRGIKDDIDLGIVAGKLGGGGHPKSSGSSIPQEIVDRFVNSFSDKPQVLLMIPNLDYKGELSCQTLT